jgi:hypothetical protein
MALLTHSHSAASLGIVLANDEGKQEHDAGRNGQHYKHVDVGEGKLALPRTENVVATPRNVPARPTIAAQNRALYFSSESLNYSRNLFGPLTYGLPRS